MFHRSTSGIFRPSPILIKNSRLIKKLPRSIPPIDFCAARVRVGFSLFSFPAYNIAAMQFYGDIFLCRARFLLPVCRTLWSRS
jgi:hypothetical protein